MPELCFSCKVLKFDGRDVVGVADESNIMAEYTSGREALPTGWKSWDEFRESIFGTLRDGSTENPEVYIDYVKKRRKELGLPKD